MAQPAPTQLDLSTLRSDGTNQGPSQTGYTKLTGQDEDHRDYVKELTKKFNANPQLVNAHGPHQFVGELPNGFALWTHTTHGGREVEEVYGNPRGGKYRSAKEFATHIGELLAANRVRDTHVRTQVRNQNLAEARQVAIKYNNDMQAEMRLTGKVMHLMNPNDPNIIAYARADGFIPHDADAAVLADQRNHTAIGVVPCNCTLR